MLATIDGKYSTDADKISFMDFIKSDPDEDSSCMITLWAAN